MVDLTAGATAELYALVAGIFNRPVGRITRHITEAPRWCGAIGVDSCKPECDIVAAVKKIIAYKYPELTAKPAASAGGNNVV